MKRPLLILMITLLAAVAARATVVRGLVVAEEDDSPLVGASVTATSERMDTIRALTDNRGRYTLEVPDSAAPYRITILQTGYRPKWSDVDKFYPEIDYGKVALQAEALTMREVEVTASSSKVIRLPDKNIVFPTKQERERSASPMSLLSQISYYAPSVRANEITGELTVGGSAPQILINGVKKKRSDLDAIDPRRIIKVEYVTYPDARFGIPYINVLVTVPETGGQVMAAAQAPVTTRKENHQAYASYHRGKHGVAVNYRGTFRDGRKEHQEDEETYIYPDHTLEYTLKGLPSRTLDRDHEGSLEYSLVESPQKAMVATAYMRYHSQDRREDQEYATPGHGPGRVTLRDGRTLSPSLELYGTTPVGANGRFEASLSGAYSHGDHRTVMAEEGYGSDTRTDSKAYTIEADACYWHSMPWSRFLVNVTYGLSGADLAYNIDGSRTDGQTHKRQRLRAVAALFGQLGRSGSYYLMAGVSHSGGVTAQTDPYVYAMYQRGIGDFNLTGYVTATSQSPHFRSVSDVPLPVNAILYSVGNPDLKGQLNVQGSLNGSYSHSHVTAEASVSYGIATDPLIMLCEYVTDPASVAYGNFLERPVNGRHSEEFKAAGSFGLSNLWNKLSISASLSYRAMRSEGAGHTWRKDCLTAYLQASVYVGRWNFGVYGSPLPSYSLNGNTVWRSNSPSWGVSVGWHRGGLSVDVSAQNLFIRNAYYQGTTTMGIGHVSKSHNSMGDFDNMVELSVRYQMSFGKQRPSPDKNAGGPVRVDTGVTN